MIGAWTINVSGRVYGPFTSERMRSFVSEGRLAAHSLIARDGSADWHEARDEPEFSDVFANRAPKATPQAALQTPSPQASEALAPGVAPLLQSPQANGGEAVLNQAAH